MDECELVKAMSNAGNQLRYDEYLRILKEESVFSEMDIELIKDVKIKKIVEENEMLLNMVKSLKEDNKILRHVCGVEVLTTEEAAIELGQHSIYSTYDWYNTLNQLKKLGLSICKVEEIKKEVKDEQ